MSTPRERETGGDREASTRFATALFSRDVHPKKVQSLLERSSITQTMDTYSHLIDDIGGDGLDEAFGYS